MEETKVYLVVSYEDCEETAMKHPFTSTEKAEEYINTLDHPDEYEVEEFTLIKDDLEIKHKIVETFTLDVDLGIVEYLGFVNHNSLDDQFFNILPNEGEYKTSYRKQGSSIFIRCPETLYLRRAVTTETKYEPVKELHFIENLMRALWLLIGKDYRNGADEETINKKLKEYTTSMKGEQGE